MRLFVILVLFYVLQLLSRLLYPKPGKNETHLHSKNEDNGKLLMVRGNVVLSWILWYKILYYIVTTAVLLFIHVFISQVVYLEHSRVNIITQNYLPGKLLIIFIDIYNR